MPVKTAQELAATFRDAADRVEKAALDLGDVKGFAQRNKVPLIGAGIGAVAGAGRRYTIDEENDGVHLRALRDAALGAGLGGGLARLGQKAVGSIPDATTVDNVMPTVEEIAKALKEKVKPTKMQRLERLGEFLPGDPDWKSNWGVAAKDTVADNFAEMAAAGSAGAIAPYLFRPVGSFADHLALTRDRVPKYLRVDSAGRPSLFRRFFPGASLPSGSDMSRGSLMLDPDALPGSLKDALPDVAKNLNRRFRHKYQELAKESPLVKRLFGTQKRISDAYDAVRSEVRTGAGRFNEAVESFIDPINRAAGGDPNWAKSPGRETKIREFAARVAPPRLSAAVTENLTKTLEAMVPLGNNGDAGARQKEISRIVEAIQKSPEDAEALLSRYEVNTKNVDGLEAFIGQAKRAKGRAASLGKSLSTRLENLDVPDTIRSEMENIQKRVMGGEDVSADVAKLKRRLVDLQAVDEALPGAKATGKVKGTVGKSVKWSGILALADFLLQLADEVARVEPTPGS